MSGPTTNRYGRLPEPNRVLDVETQRYLYDLLRSIEEVNSMMFSDETGFVFGAARKRPSIEVSTTYTIGVSDSIILADSSAATFAVTLPTALDAKNTFYDIKKIDTNVATVVSVEGSGSEFPLILNGSGQPSVTVYSDGSNFWII